MKYQLRITFLSIVTIGLLHGMEQEQKLIPGLPNPENVLQEASAWKQHTATCMRIADAMEKEIH